MAPRGFEDEELTISLSSSHVRRQFQQQQEQQQQQHAGRNDPVASAGHNAAMDTHPRKPDKVKTEQRIGAYKVVRTLGEGSFGKVKLAIHNGTGQHVALKIIARKKLISRDMAGRVEREIEYLQLLRHPHIIKLYVLCLMEPGQGIKLTRYEDTPLLKHLAKLSWFSSTPEVNSSTTSLPTVV